VILEGETPGRGNRPGTAGGVTGENAEVQHVPGQDLTAAAVVRPTQVFVDDSGRRRRWTRMAGAGVTALCATYVAIIGVGLSQTTVGPLIAVPVNADGPVAGFPDSSGSVPGLLATGGVTAAAPKAASTAKKASTAKPASTAKTAPTTKTAATTKTQTSGT
jgi:hypothetical protein